MCLIGVLCTAINHCIANLESCLNAGAKCSQTDPQSETIDIVCDVASDVVYDMVNITYDVQSRTYDIAYDETRTTL